MPACGASNIWRQRSTHRWRACATGIVRLGRNWRYSLMHRYGTQVGLYGFGLVAMVGVRATLPDYLSVWSVWWWLWIIAICHMSGIIGWKLCKFFDGRKNDKAKSIHSITQSISGKRRRGKSHLPFSA